MNIGYLIWGAAGVCLVFALVVLTVEAAYDSGFEDGFEQGKEAGMKSLPSSPIPHPSHSKEVR